jgi:phosphoglycolate phosphatase-like HAD superfamily hydrolase
MSKEIIIFDVDGVLIESHGYHQAFKDTVRVGAKELGYDVTLSDEDIARFEGMGISSEWHSSAACMAVLAISGKFDLGPLFASIANEQAKIPVRIRLERAVHQMAIEAGVDPAHPVSLIQNSETINSFPFDIFQEMILGSAEFEEIYEIKSILGVESYLSKFDRPQLGTDSRDRLFDWFQHPERGCAIMTNRPSRKMPDAKYAQKLVALENIPVAGYGEMEWLAEKFGGEAAEYSKPSPIHALSAALASFGKDSDTCLLEACAATKGEISDDIVLLDGYEFTVFEDTPAGIISVGAMGDLLRAQGLDVKVNKIGITSSPLKGEYLKAQGAQVFADVNTALEDVLSS